MANLARSWRSLLGQQAVTTGRSITPEQAAALRRGELEATYNITGEAEDRALRRRQVEEGLALQSAGLEAQSNQFAESMAAREREFGTTSQLSQKQFEEQQAQNREQNRLNQSNIDKSSSAATTSGLIQAALAIPTMYMAYDRYNNPVSKLDKVLAQQKLAEINAGKTPQAIAPVETATDINREFFNQPTYDYGGGYNYPAYDFGNYDYGYYDYGGGYNYPAYDYGGTDINYDFFNNDAGSYDWGGLWDFLGW